MCSSGDYIIRCASTNVTHLLCRLTLDPDDILAWTDYKKDDVLSHACLSAKWENNDAIDQAVTAAIGSREVRSEFGFNAGDLLL